MLDLKQILCHNLCRNLPKIFRGEYTCKKLEAGLKTKGLR